MKPVQILSGPQKTQGQLFAVHIVPQQMWSVLPVALDQYLKLGREGPTASSPGQSLDLVFLLGINNGSQIQPLLVVSASC